VNECGTNSIDLEISVPTAAAPESSAAVFSIKRQPSLIGDLSRERDFSLSLTAFTA
jgi:hypothetical protein